MTVTAIHGLGADSIGDDGAAAIAIGTVPRSAPQVRTDVAAQGYRAPGGVHHRVPGTIVVGGIGRRERAGIGSANRGTLMVYSDSGALEVCLEHLIAPATRSVGAALGRIRDGPVDRARVGADVPRESEALRVPGEHLCCSATGTDSADCRLVRLLDEVEVATGHERRCGADFDLRPHLGERAPPAFGMRRMGTAAETLLTR